jgi:hypothetical protein
MTPVPPWTAWHRPGPRQPWRAVHQGDTYRQCLAWLRGHSLLTQESCILRGGTHPNDRVGNVQQEGKPPPFRPCKIVRLLR